MTTTNQAYQNATAIEQPPLRISNQLLHGTSDNDAFDVNGVATNFSKTCNYSQLDNSNGKYEYNFACIPSNATNTKKAKCIRFAPERMPDTFDCDYFFGGQWRKASDQEGLTCIGNCQGPPEAKAIGAGISAYPSFTLTITALFVVFVMFKRTWTKSFY